MTQSNMGFIQRTTAKPLAPVQFEMVVDNFAGAGGASMGIEAALGRAVDVAINHNPQAVEIHQVNHPNTVHFTENIWKVDPIEACAGRPVGLAWFSPDCTHFSKAKGGQPVKKSIRGLAWVVIKWAKLVKPRVIILENVEEFKDWGPVGADSMPITSRKREYFNNWKSMLRRQGYEVDHRELIAADYGAPTIRKRFFLIARCDGQPIVWPSQTHWKRSMANPGQPTWRSAAECIDWTLPCPSIFTRKRALADNTMRRVAMGMKKFVFDSNEPFIVTCNHQGGDRTQSTLDPMMTLTAARDAHGLVVPFTAGAGGPERAGKPRDIKNPSGTILKKNSTALIAPSLIGIDNKGSNGSCVWDPRDPTRTITMENRHALVSAFLNKHYSGVSGGYHIAQVQAFLIKYFGTATGQDLFGPIHTLTAKHRMGLVEVQGVDYQIFDIGLRMLTPAELLRAQFGKYASNYILLGTNSRQVAAIGNSVCPELAEALVKANVVIKKVA